uniref:Uncharacterized protein n=1 Tax=uncultured Planctomycetota bacterium TaxID=120965 RepID=H5SFR6_9BACT|nr:hypothetical protein HGMM_F22C11C17 [uncultured Planctomycetota bacterium]
MILALWHSQPNLAGACVVVKPRKYELPQRLGLPVLESFVGSEGGSWTMLLRRAE